MRRDTSETTMASILEMSVNSFSAAARAFESASGCDRMREHSFFSASVSRETSPW